MTGPQAKEALRALEEQITITRNMGRTVSVKTLKRRNQLAAIAATAVKK